MVDGDDDYTNDAARVPVWCLFSDKEPRLLLLVLVEVEEATWTRHSYRVGSHGRLYHPVQEHLVILRFLGVQEVLVHRGHLSSTLAGTTSKRLYLYPII